ncbi:MAG: hypothetical protein Q8Q56_01045, partial [Alphaproteobacteria bacterium]|nr:hypothetical protein [Alphaproteobacteria bacterium]
ASLFVPVLAYMILKGGISSFVHIAGNMMQASQGAAGAAAQEQVTGNYSYGNVSLGNTQYNTAQMNQQGVAARFSDGYMQESTGHYELTYTPEGSVMDQKVSHLPVSFSVGKSLSNGYQRRAESALNSAYSDGAQLNQTWDQSYREMVSLDQHMGQNSGMNSGQSMGIDTSTQQSMQTVMSQAQTFAKKYGIEESRAISYLAGLNGTAGIGGNLKGVAFNASANLGANYSGSASKQQMIEDAMSIATSKDFTESMSQLKRFSQNTEFSEGQDIGKRLSETISTSFDRSDHLSKSIGQHLSVSETLSRSASYAKDNSARMDQNYNDEMWQGFVQHVGGNASEAASIYNSKEGWARGVVEDFNVQYFQRMEHQLMKQSDARISSDSGFHTATSGMAKHHDASVDKMETPSRTFFESKRDELKEISGVSEVDQDIQTNKETFKAGENDIQQNLKTGLKSQKESLNATRKEMQQGFKENDEEWIGTKAGRALWPGIDLNKTSKKD